MPRPPYTAEPRIGSRGSESRFARIPSVDIPRSSFNRSCGLKTAFDSGYLVPIFADEALPGDTFSLKATLYGRIIATVRPVMDNLYLDTFWFAVPNRLLWDNWERFNGAQDDPGDSVDFVMPTLTANSAAEGSLSDYLGIPPGVSLAPVSLWHRAYNLIWNEWFRSEDLQNSVVVDTDDGPDDIADYVLLRRGKRHDYFTSSLPFTQKFDAVPSAIEGTGVAPSMAPVSGFPTGSSAVWEFGATDDRLGRVTPAASAQAVAFDDPGLVLFVNELRNAVAVQRLYERDARGGTRYTEIVRSHFGVSSPDSRLQRPEYLGGSSDRILTAPIPNVFNAASESVTAIWGGYATMSAQPRWIQSFTEHCVVIGLANVRADLTYQQGLHKMFSRSDRLDFYWPAFSHLGEQEVKNREIYAQGTGADNLTFGYQERYAEYRYKPSQTTGVMRSQHTNSLDLWHLALDFSSLPVLNATFIEDQPPVDRVVPTTLAAGQEVLLDCFFDYRCARPMPTYSVPGLMDHF